MWRGLSESDRIRRKKDAALYSNFVTMLQQQSGCTYTNCTATNCTIRYPSYDYKQEVGNGAEICGNCTCINVVPPSPPIPPIPPTGPLWFAKVNNEVTQEFGWGVSSDSTGNLFFSGTYEDSPTIYNIVSDSSSPVPHTPTITLTNEVEKNAFLVKYNSSGEIQWATQIAGNKTTDSAVLTVCDGTDIYIQGSFLSTVIFYNGVTSGSPSAASINLTNISGEETNYIAKYNGTTGAVIWATKVTTSSGNLNTASLPYINNNTLLINYCSKKDISVYDATTSGDTGSSILTYTAASSITSINVLVKYNLTTGAIIWTNIVEIATDGSLIAGDISFDSSNNIYIIFSYNDTITFYNPNGRSAATTSGSTLATVSPDNACIAKYNSSGQYQLSVPIAIGDNVQSLRISCNNINELICSATTDDVVTLYNPSSVSVMSSAALSGTENAIVFKYSASLIPQWITQISNVDVSKENLNSNILIDASNNIYLIGTYSDDIIPYEWNGSASISSGTTITYINTTGVPIASNGFILKYSSAGAFIGAAKITDIAFSGLCKLSSTILYIAGTFGVSVVFYEFTTSGDPSTVLMTQTGGLELNAFLFTLPITP